MEIRKIEPKDFAKVAQLENENWSFHSTPIVMNSSVEKILEKTLKGTTYFLATDNQKILGIIDFSTKHPFESSQHVATFGLMTIKEARGKGIASLLINHIFEIARQENYKKITISVLGSNFEAISLYTKMGFVEEGRIKKEFYLDGKYVDDLTFCYYLDEKFK